jgi:hypothetical protein
MRAPGDNNVRFLTESGLGVFFLRVKALASSSISTQGNYSIKAPAPGFVVAARVRGGAIAASFLRCGIFGFGKVSRQRPNRLLRMYPLLDRRIDLIDGYTGYCFFQIGIAA